MIVCLITLSISSENQFSLELALYEEKQVFAKCLNSVSYHFTLGTDFKVWAVGEEFLILYRKALFSSFSPLSFMVFLFAMK